MIRIEKGDAPPFLTANSAAWTATVVSKLAKGEEPTKTEKGRYNHPDIKSALVAETHGKCAYCESKLRHVTFGDIEHVVPKSSNPAKWFSWSNLTLACDVCNTKKSNATIDHETFVDPYVADPEQEFWHVGALIYPRPGRDAAALTEHLLELNRAELFERRAARITALMKMLEVVERCRNPSLKQILWEDFCRETDASKEYAALSRSVASLAKAKLGYE
ncbi:MAG: hypothetical protein H6Q99_3383 [Proteobacteria bacterium]|nr:hypothetical protein [Pseudomonadota bacterium]